MAFTALNIEQFRGLRKLEVHDLRRVNLLVGRNNSGKTTLLEAVELLGLFPNPQAVVERIERRKGRSRLIRSALATTLQAASQAVLFCTLDSRKTDGFFMKLTDLRIQEERLLIDLDPDAYEDLIRYRRRQFEPLADRQLAFFKDEQERMYIQTQTYQIEFGLAESQFHSAFRVIEWRRPDVRRTLSPYYYLFQRDESNEAIVSTVEATKQAKELLDLNQLINSDFVSTSLDVTLVEQRFESILLDGKLPKLVDAARAIDPRINNITSTPSGVILFEVEGAGMLPAHFMGEGVLRIVSLLAQIVSLPPGGVCLIDEIDTGLHFTALPTMWKAILQAARQHDIQLFVTTHSDECVRALVDVLKGEDRPLADADCKLYRLEQEAERTRAYDYDMDLIDHSMHLNWGYR